MISTWLNKLLATLRAATPPGIAGGCGSANVNATAKATSHQLCSSAYAYYLAHCTLNRLNATDGLVRRILRRMPTQWAEGESG